MCLTRFPDQEGIKTRYHCGYLARWFAPKYKPKSVRAEVSNPRANLRYLRPNGVKRTASRPDPLATNRCCARANLTSRAFALRFAWALCPCSAIAGAFTVVLDDQDFDLVRASAVDHRVRKQAHREATPASWSRRSDTRMLDQEHREPFKLGDEPCRQYGGSLPLVEGSRFLDISLSARMECDLHPGKRVSSLAMAASRGTA